jgi:hypothetical protein
MGGTDTNRAASAGWNDKFVEVTVEFDEVTVEPMT